MSSLRFVRHLVAALAVVLVSTGGGAGAASKPPRAPVSGAVEIRFSGRGQEARRAVAELFFVRERASCYARQTVDETATFDWTITWASVSLRALARRSLSRAGAPSEAMHAGRLAGAHVRDDCENPVEVPEDWVGIERCDKTLTGRTQGSLQILPGRARGSSVTLAFAAAELTAQGDSLCALSVRSDQLTARVSVDVRKLSRLAKGKTLSIPVGTSRPSAGARYSPEVVCTQSLPPYEGARWQQICSDRIAWEGSVTFTKR